MGEVRERLTERSNEDMWGMIREKVRERRNWAKKERTAKWMTSNEHKRRELNALQRQDMRSAPG